MTNEKLEKLRREVAEKKRIEREIQEERKLKEELEKGTVRGWLKKKVKDGIKKL